MTAERDKAQQDNERLREALSGPVKDLLHKLMVTLELYADPACCDGVLRHEDKCPVGSVLVECQAAIDDLNEETK